MRPTAARRPDRPRGDGDMRRDKQPRTENGLETGSGEMQIGGGVKDCSRMGAAQSSADRRRGRSSAWSAGSSVRRIANEGGA